MIALSLTKMNPNFFFFVCLQIHCIHCARTSLPSETLQKFMVILAEPALLSLFAGVVVNMIALPLMDQAKPETGWNSSKTKWCREMEGIRKSSIFAEPNVREIRKLLLCWFILYESLLFLCSSSLILSACSRTKVDDSWPLKLLLLLLSPLHNHFTPFGIYHSPCPPWLSNYPSHFFCAPLFISCIKRRLYTVL